MWVCLIILCRTNSLAQDSILQLKLLHIIGGKFSNFSTDNMGNILLVNADNELIKYNSRFDSVASYKNLSAGNLSVIDAGNPLQILLYYSEQNTLILLDRQLNLINTIDLNGAGINKVSAITRSYDNNFWLFDEWSNTIKKIDNNGAVLMTSTEFRLLKEGAHAPQKMMDNGGSLYLYDTAGGWMVFDYYLGLQKQYPYLKWRNVWVENGWIKGMEGDWLVASLPQQMLYERKKLSISLKALKVVVAGNKLYSQDNKGLNVYTIE